MPNQFYCSVCGAELIYTRKAVPGKGRIFDLIDPHECDGYAIHENELGKPTVLDVLDNLKDLSKTIDNLAEGERHSGFRKEPGDKRGEASTAPDSLLSSIRSLEPSNEDLDE